jgi:hypothetical protein
MHQGQFLSDQEADSPDRNPSGSIQVMGSRPHQCLRIDFSYWADGVGGYSQVMQLLHRFACWAGVGRVLHGDGGWQRMPSAGRADA